MDTLTLSLSGVLQILYMQVVLGNGCLKFQGRCCTLCNPGYYLRNKCGICFPCPAKGYADKPNNKPYCDHCERCEGIFLYIENCTSTRNAVCTCIPGMKCTNEKCTQCISDPCPAGQHLDGQNCMNCPLGTFNSGTEHSICTPWTNCSALGGVIITNGSHTSDVVCGYFTKAIQSTAPSSEVNAFTTKVKPVVRPVQNDLPVVYIVVSAAVGLFLIAICVACRQKLTEKIKHVCLQIPKPIVKQTEEEDGCSCHFPEEEENEGENEPMTLEA